MASDEPGAVQTLQARRVRLRKDSPKLSIHRQIRRRTLLDQIRPHGLDFKQLNHEGTWVVDKARMRPPIPQCSMSELAQNIEFIEITKPFRYEASMKIGPTIDIADVAASLAPVKSTACIRNFSFENVDFAPNCLVFFKDGIKMNDTNYLIPDDTFSGAKIVFDDIIVDDSDKPLIIGYNMGWTGYYHWLIQSMPAIDHSIRGRETDVRIAIPALGKWHKELFDLVIGGHHVEIVTMDFFRHYTARKLEYCEFINGKSAFTISEKAAETFGRIKSMVCDDTTRKDKIIYIDRSDTVNRVMRNENALVEYLKERGVEIIKPSSMDVASQITAFSRARVVIGPHGGGLSNIVFCSPGTVLYELFPDHYVNSCFNRLAQCGGLDYWADMFPATGRGYLHDWSWEVDMDIFGRRFATIVSTIT